MPEIALEKSMWFLFQSLIIGGVVLHNHYYQWTPNKLLACVIGVGLAFLITLLANRLRMLARN